LIHLIEAHSEQIIGRVLHDIRHDPELSRMRSLPEAELREWGQNILEKLGHWLALGHEEELARHYEKLGQVRFEEGVPLAEAARALCLLKDKTVDFVKEQVVAQNIVELYAEEELERRMGHFFDVLAVHLIRGYEEAWRRVAQEAGLTASGR
jgi:hypothetical protein